MSLYKVVVWEFFCLACELMSYLSDLKFHQQCVDAWEAWLFQYLCICSEVLLYYEDFRYLSEPDLMNAIESLGMSLVHRQSFTSIQYRGENYYSVHFEFCDLTNATSLPDVQYAKYHIFVSVMFTYCPFLSFSLIVHISISLCAQYTNKIKTYPLLS